MLAIRYSLRPERMRRLNVKFDPDRINYDAEKVKAVSMHRRELAREGGYCQKCKNPQRLAAPGKTCCLRCLEIMRENKSRHAARYAEQERRRKERLSRAALCVRCGINPQEFLRARCATCLERHRLLVQASRERRKGIPE